MRHRYGCASGWRKGFLSVESIRFLNRSTMRHRLEPEQPREPIRPVWGEEVRVRPVAVAVVAAEEEPRPAVAELTWHRMLLTCPRNAASQALIRRTSSRRIIYGSCRSGMTSAGSPEILRCAPSLATGSGAGAGVLLLDF